MDQPDARRDHRFVWNNVPRTRSVFEKIWSLTRSSDHSLFFSACNASPSHCPALKHKSMSSDGVKSQELYKKGFIVVTIIPLISYCRFSTRTTVLSNFSVLKNSQWGLAGK